MRLPKYWDKSAFHKNSPIHPISFFFRSFGPLERSQVAFLVLAQDLRLDSSGSQRTRKEVKSNEN